MAHLIDKDALVAEIKRRKQVAFGWMETAPNDAIEAEFELCDDILSFLNTLEMKDVDLEKEANECWNYVFSTLGWNENSLMTINHKEFLAFAKHFYELGLKATED